MKKTLTKSELSTDNDRLRRELDITSRAIHLMATSCPDLQVCTIGEEFDYSLRLYGINRVKPSVIVVLTDLSGERSQSTRKYNLDDLYYLCQTKLDSTVYQEIREAVNTMHYRWRAHIVAE